MNCCFTWICFTLVSEVLLFHSAFAVSNTLKLVNSFLERNQIHFAVIINCGTSGEDLETLKLFSDKEVRIKIQKADVAVKLASLLEVENHKLAVILDGKCTESIPILRQASERKLFSRLHFWLILTISNHSADTQNVDVDITTAPNENFDGTSDYTQRSLNLSQEQHLLMELELLDIPLDSQVIIAQRGHKSNEILLQDVYRIMSWLPNTFTPHREWSPGQSFPIGPRRDDYGGILFQTATVVVGDVWKNFLDLRYKHINSLTKFHYVLVEHVSRMLNFRTNVTPVDSWGFPVNNTIHYDGVIGLFQRGEIQMASVGLLHKTARMDKLEYAGETVCYEGAFLFLEPSLSDVSNIYTLPFSRAVWLTYFIIMVSFSYALYITQRAESGLEESQLKQPLSWSDSLFTAIGIVCQEGSPRDPQSLSSRIIFLSLLLLSLFLATSYSAIIVSLLQTTSTAIKSLKDLMDSPFKLTMNNVVSSLKYVNETTDSDIKDLYFKHLFTQPYHEAFTSPKVGVEKMRKGLHAFHGDADAYRIMSETYEEHEKCRLKDIKMFTTVQLGFAVMKGAPFKEHVRQRARWLKESGISDREYKHWLVQKPKCHGNTEGFTSVRLQDFYPALLVFGYGFVLSVGALILECLFIKLRYLKARNYEL